MTARVCRWGILGTAGIARKNWQAIRLAGNAALVAVASRSLERSREFIAACQAACPQPPAPAAVEGYAELLRRSDVDAVYIPLPTGLRKQWVLEAARAGKHVLVEKPVGVTAADVREMLDECERHRVQLMDGVMFLHGRRLEVLRRTLDDGASVGEVRRIAAQFSFNGADEFFRSDIRMSSQLEPHGCLGDLGWYTIGFALWVMKYELPTHVIARELAAPPAPTAPGRSRPSCPASFSSGAASRPGFYCSFRTENQQWANVSGTKGVVHVSGLRAPVLRRRDAVRGHELRLRGHRLRLRHAASHARRRRPRVQQQPPDGPGGEPVPRLLGPRRQRAGSIPTGATSR